MRSMWRGMAHFSISRKPPHKNRVPSELEKANVAPILDDDMDLATKEMVLLEGNWKMNGDSSCLFKVN